MDHDNRLVQGVSRGSIIVTALLATACGDNLPAAGAVWWSCLATVTTPGLKGTDPNDPDPADFPDLTSITRTEVCRVPEADPDSVRESCESKCGEDHRQWGLWVSSEFPVINVTQNADCDVVDAPINTGIACGPPRTMSALTSGGRGPAMYSIAVNPNASSATIGVDGNQGTTSVSGTIRYSVPRSCTVDCELTLVDITLSGENFELGGETVSGTDLRNFTNASGTIAGQDGEFAFPTEAVVVVANFDVAGEHGSIAFANETPVTGSIDPATGAFLLGGTFTSPDGTLTVDLAGERTNGPPTAVLDVPTSVECTGVLTDVPLDGSGSFDLDGNVTEHAWTAEGSAVTLGAIGQGAVTSASLPLGTYRIGLTVFDSSGSAASDAAPLAVVDTTAPEFSFVPSDVTTTTCGSFGIGTATAADRCGGAVTITNDRPIQFAPGTTIVTWTAVDARGNATTATQRVTVLLGDNPTCCPGNTNVILGTSNDDSLSGTEGADCILGLGGQDAIDGHGGDDFVAGGNGNDVVRGGNGGDRIFGGSGQDTLLGESGSDLLRGGDGDDTVDGGSGDDTLHGGQGQDLLRGQEGDDRIFGDDGDDLLQGGSGNDTLAGGVNNDTCDGGGGSNTFAQCEVGPPSSCDDDLANGTETDVDCGGACPACGAGESCSSGSDCQGGYFCVGAVCTNGPGGGAGLVHAELGFSSDWGGGYCAVLNVTNDAAVATSSFTVLIDTSGSTIYTSWNGAFSGPSGAITVSPVAWNAVVAPGQTNSSIGFCANRPAGSTALPSVTDTVATF